MLSISVKGISSRISFESGTSSIIPRYDFPCCLQTNKTLIECTKLEPRGQEIFRYRHRITCNCKQLNFSVYDLQEIHKNSCQKSTAALQTRPPKNKQARPCSQTQSVISQKKKKKNNQLNTQITLHVQLKYAFKDEQVVEQGNPRQTKGTDYHIKSEILKSKHLYSIVAKA